jgi:hypothetical protein
MVIPQGAIMALIPFPVKAWDELMGDLSDEHPNQWAPPQGQLCQHFFKMGMVSPYAMCGMYGWVTSVSGLVIMTDALVSVVKRHGLSPILSI